ncbi:MAG TPA: hypothetical protein VG368_00590, partial [Acidimicrobiales bacterium]|nr:hypothetical protein [Acidimicrobiales bacterium]
MAIVLAVSTPDRYISPHFCHLFARLLTLFVVAASLVALRPLPAHGATVPTPCSSQPSSTLATGGQPYYLFESDGVIFSCGGAPLYGSMAGAKVDAPVIGGAATSSGSGYWLATADGGIHPFGSAGFFGSPVHLHLPAPIVAFVPTPDGNGYWLVTGKGNLFHYGDAGFYGSTVHDRQDGAVVALLPTPDGNGYWIVSSKGVVRQFGDAPPVGSLAHRRPSVVAAAANPDGRGLLLLTKDGGVHNLGTSGFYGSLVHRRLPRPLTVLVATTDGSGYVLVNASGSVFNFGDANFGGSLAASPPKRPTRVIALAEVTLPAPLPAAPAATLTSTSVAPSALVPHGQFGYDVSNFQCASPGSSLAATSLPASSPFSVIEAAGWLDGADNSCLASEAAWANASAGSGGAPYGLYLFTNSPDQSAGATAIDANGPAGQCATLASNAQPACVAYNYGYEGAAAAFSYAASVGVSASLWWLDVEGTNLSGTQWSNFSAGQFWSSSTALNADTI